MIVDELIERNADHSFDSLEALVRAGSTLGNEYEGCEHVVIRCVGRRDEVDP